MSNSKSLFKWYIQQRNSEKQPKIMMQTYIHCMDKMMTPFI